MREIAPFGVRLPLHLKDQLSQSAKNNHRSLNSEIIAQLEMQQNNQIVQKLDEILQILKQSQSGL